MTDEHIHDLLNNIKLEWTEIRELGTLDLRWHFLCVTPFYNSEVYRQIKNPSKYVLLKIEQTLSKKNLKINLSIVRGNNKDITKVAKSLWLKRNANNSGFMLSVDDE